jgi:iron complex outermembrane receptor protein
MTRTFDELPPARRRTRTLATLAASIVAAGSALAQTPGADDTALEEIVVTAQRRAQSAQDVGIALSVVDSAALQNRSIQNVAEIAFSLPSVQANQTNDLVTFNVRGIGMNEFTTNLDSPVAVNVDEIYQSKTFMTATLLYDIERVEVLKGPQGTLYGRNATGGTVSFFTKRPTEKLEFGGSVGFGDYDTLRIEPYFSGPLGNGFTARLSGLVVDQGEGFYENDTLSGTDGKQRRYAGRFQLAWEGADTDALLSFNYGKDESIGNPVEGVGIFTPASLAAGSPTFCAEYLAGTARGDTANCVRGIDGLTPGDNNPFTTSNSQRAFIDIESYGGALRVNRETKIGTLTSITGYQYARRNWREDSDGSPGFFIDANWDGEIDQYVQELRLTGSTDRWSYVAGGYYQRDDYTNGDYIVIASGAAPGFYSPFNQELNAFAVYAHNNFQLTDTVALVAGLRYSNEEVTIRGGTFVGAGLIDPPGRPSTLIAQVANSANLPDGGERRDAQTTYKAGVEWKPEVRADVVDKLLVYASVSTGFRSGGYNAVFTASQAEMTSLSPEKITAYEVGFKSTLLDRALFFNGGFFHYDFQDGFINVDSASSPVPITINAANVKISGAELDVTWQPSKGVRFAAGVGWLDSKIGSDITTGGSSLRNNSTINAPEWSTSFEASFEQPLSDALTITAALDANYRSSQFLESSNSPISLEPGYWIAGARVGLGPAHGRWQVSLWAKNLFDEEYRQYVNDLPGFGWVINLYGQPRTYGVTLKAEF